MNRILFLTCLCLSTLVFVACNSVDIISIKSRHETARRLALPVQMLPQKVQTQPFLLTTFARTTKPGGEVTFYLEGDGMAFISRRQPSLDPTPKNPVALHLASHDNHANVIYIARPCQFVDKVALGPCRDNAYWGLKRYSPEVVNSVNQAIEYYVKKHDFRAVNLVGYSGGAAIAILIASRRPDVVSVRTVAGNLDHNTFTEIHGVTPMTESLNPVHEAANISHIPQHHFIGEWDDRVTPGIYISYRNASRNLSCVRHSIVKETDHQNGWVDRWPELLQAPLNCAN